MTMSFQMLGEGELSAIHGMMTSIVDRTTELLGRMHDSALHWIMR